MFAVGVIYLCLSGVFGLAWARGAGHLFRPTPTITRSKTHHEH